MKTVLPLSNKLHDFHKVNLITDKNVRNWYRCNKCGLSGYRPGLSDKIIIDGTEKQIRNCSGQRNLQVEYIKYIKTFKTQVVKIVTPIAIMGCENLGLYTEHNTVPCPFKHFSNQKIGEIWLRNKKKLPCRLWNHEYRLVENGEDQKGKEMAENKTQSKVNKVSINLKLQTRIMVRVAEFLTEKFFIEGLDISSGFKDESWTLYCNNMFLVTGKKFNLWNKVLVKKYSKFVSWKMQYLHDITKAVLKEDHKVLFVSSISKIKGTIVTQIITNENKS